MAILLILYFYSDLKPQQTYSVTKAQKKLESYCVYQDRCYKEVINKLQEMHMIPIAIDEIITKLVANNFLNEERFAKSYARGKFNIKHWGKNRIVRELKFRNISAYNIKTALQEINEVDYLEKLHVLATTKMASVTEVNVFKKRKKIADYLLYRGWESHLIFDKLAEILP